MHDFLFHYHRVHPATWAYLSSLLSIAIYFKFSRLWSMRNLDLIGLILFAPGLLITEFGRTQGVTGVEQLGYVWLFSLSGLFLIRLLCDPMMVRRPLLEPNLSVGGLTFLAAALLVFLMANVITSNLTEEDLAGSQAAEQLRTRQEVAAGSLATRGPGYHLLFLFPRISTMRILSADSPDDEPLDLRRKEDRALIDMATTRTVAILAHLAVVIGLVTIGYRHFDNIRTGIAAATLYLMLPYTAQWTGNIDHVLPAALLVWAIAAYRRPLISGMLIGLAIGAIYYPVFLLPLWLSFYWQRGLLRFVIGIVSMIAVLAGCLTFLSPDLATFLALLRQMFGWRVPVVDNLGGFWQYVDPYYRVPVMAAFVALCGSLAVWPAQKNLGTLISCSAAVMLSTQFWHAYGGGLFMAWYLPLLLLTIFRPNLEDRVALTVLGEGWRPRRKEPLGDATQAA